MSTPPAPYLFEEATLSAPGGARPILVATPQVQTATGAEQQLAQLNAWDLRTLNLTYTVGAKKVLAELLPPLLGTLERTEPMVKEMLAAIPAPLRE